MVYFKQNLTRLITVCANCQKYEQRIRTHRSLTQKPYALRVNRIKMLGKNENVLHTDGWWIVRQPYTWNEIEVFWIVCKRIALQPSASHQFRFVFYKFPIRAKEKEQLIWPRCRVVVSSVFACVNEWMSLVLLCAVYELRLIVKEIKRQNVRTHTFSHIYRCQNEQTGIPK